MENIIHYISKNLSKKGIDDVVISSSEMEGKHLKFVNNEVVKTGSELTSNISIFCSKDKKTIYTSLKDISKTKADELIKKIIEFSKDIPPSDDYYGISKGPFKYKSKIDYDKNIMNIDESDLLEKGINKALEDSKRVAGDMEIWHLKTHLVTSGNVDVLDHSSSLYFSIRAFKEK